MQSRLEEAADEGRGIISKRRPGDKYPKYFVCTDLTLTVQQVLQYYQRRWPVEVNNLYLKEALGLSDFRLQSFEATDKWFAVAVLARSGGVPHLLLSRALAPSASAQVAVCASVLKGRYANFGEPTVKGILPLRCGTICWRFLPPYPERCLDE
ncbi:MAG: hypothetical protein ACUVWZ_11470 [Anaerolineae bacterium]